MKYGVYSIRDQMVGYSQPSLAVNDDVAKRQFEMLVNDPSGTQISATPQYFDLYRIGEFDNESGVIAPLKNPDLILPGISFKKGDSNG